MEQPKEKGGWGLDFAANIIGMEEQIYAQVPGNFNLQSDLVMPYIASHGTDAQIQVKNDTLLTVIEKLLKLKT